MNLISLANQFAVAAPVTRVTSFGTGNINDTYLVETGPSSPRYLLQRINRSVFPQPDWIMANLARIHDHMGQKLLRGEIEGRWELPRVVTSATGADHVLDEKGDFYRLQAFIEGSCTYPAIGELSLAAEVGRAVARFHRLIADLPADELHDTLPGFHYMPGYLADYHRHYARWDKNNPTEEERFCFNFIAARHDRIGALEAAQARGELQMLPIHGDPKVDNILFDAVTDQAISVIDLDTAKPGLIHYDIGDMLRSGCNPLGEHESNWQSVRFELDFAEALLTAYCREAGPFLTEADYRFIYTAIHQIAFEMGLRFFSDYLNGNVYFNAPAEINLLRALVQFQLVSSIEENQRAIQQLVSKAATPV